MITVVVPVYNEKDNVLPLLHEIAEAARIVPISEIIYVDDNSTDETFDILQSLKAEFPLLRALRHTKNSGQSAALWTGIREAGNDLIVTMDGDGQNNPADIIRLYDEYGAHRNRLNKIAILGERENVMIMRFAVFPRVLRMAYGDFCFVIIPRIRGAR